MLLPTDPKERKEVPIATGVLDYFPKALAEIAKVSVAGNKQHGLGPLHWDKTKSTDEADALIRHFLERGTLDSDGLRHSAKMSWRALALLERELEAEQKRKDPNEINPLEAHNLFEFVPGSLIHCYHGENAIAVSEGASYQLELANQFAKDNPGWSSTLNYTSLTNQSSIIFNIRDFWNCFVVRGKVQRKTHSVGSDIQSGSSNSSTQNISIRNKDLSQMHLFRKEPDGHYK